MHEISIQYPISVWFWTFNPFKNVVIHHSIAVLLLLWFFTIFIMYFTLFLDDITQRNLSVNKINCLLSFFFMVINHITSFLLCLLLYFCTRSKIIWHIYRERKKCWLLIKISSWSFSHHSFSHKTDFFHRFYFFNLNHCVLRNTSISSVTFVLFKAFVKGAFFGFKPLSRLHCPNFIFPTVDFKHQNEQKQKKFENNASGKCNLDFEFSGKFTSGKCNLDNVLSPLFWVTKLILTLKYLNGSSTSQQSKNDKQFNNCIS